MAIQSLSQMTRLFPGDKGFQTVQANMDQMFFGIRDLETAREVSAWIGQTTVQSASYQQSTSTSRPAWFASGQGSKSSPTVSKTEGVTYSETARALIQPEELLRLPDNIALVLSKGIAPFACSVVRYYSDPAFSEALADQNSSVPIESVPIEAANQLPQLAEPKPLALICPKCRIGLRSLPVKPGRKSRCPSCHAEVTLRRRVGRSGNQRQ